jgi:hypothetical protein
MTESQSLGTPIFQSPMCDKYANWQGKTEALDESPSPMPL